ncbi:uracil-DNA glycosylase family protein [Planctomycetota bacterium]
MTNKETLKNYLKLARMSGLSALPRPDGPPPTAAPAPASPAAADPPAGDNSAENTPAEDLGDLGPIKKMVEGCKRCDISEHIRNYVFGEGNPRARLMFIGEAPGQDEDVQGRPFVGRAGELLNDIITKGMRLKREDVYIANILKCRPPKNRNPLPDEAANCIGYLNEQIRFIKPEVIVTLGKVPTQFLLDTETAISRLRGTFAEYMEIPLMPTFHPAYLLRTPSAKRDVWEDIKQVMTRLGMETPS